MTWAPTEAQKSIFEVLSTDSALTTLLGGAKVYDNVPDNTAYPYVVLYILPFIDRGNHTLEGLECELQVSVWHQERGNLPIQNIQKRIDELLHLAEPCIDGWNITGLRRTFVDIVTDTDNITKQGIQRFKLMIGEA